MSKKEVDALVDGGNATPGPPLGPTLGALGVNTGKVVAEINEKTKEYGGMKIPVKIIIDEESKDFEIKVGSPPASALIKKELGIEKGTHAGETVGNLTFIQLTKIAEAKKDSLLANDLKAVIKEIVGVCQCLGVTVEGRNAKELTLELSNGVFDDVITGKTDVIPERAHKVEEKKVKLVVEEKAVEEEGEAPEEGAGEEGKPAEDKKDGDKK